MADEPEDIENAISQAIWVSMFRSVVSFAISFREYRKDPGNEPHPSDVQFEAMARIKALTDRVRGNRSLCSEMSPGDQILTFEALLAEAQAILEEGNQ
jgi:hypothetical protein